MQSFYFARAAQSQRHFAPAASRQDRPARRGKRQPRPEGDGDVAERDALEAGLRASPCGDVLPALHCLQHCLCRWFPQDHCSPDNATPKKPENRCSVPGAGAIGVWGNGPMRDACREGRESPRFRGKKDPDPFCPTSAEPRVPPSGRSPPPAFPSEPCFEMNAFWASENRDAFITLRSSQPGNGAENSNQNDPALRSQITASKFRNISILRLERIGCNPQKAALDASWAEVFVARSGQRFAHRRVDHFK